MQTVSPPVPQPHQQILVSLWLSWQRTISNKEERGEGVVRGWEVCVCAQTAWKWDSQRAASLAKGEQKPNCCAGCVSFRGHHVFQFSANFSCTRGTDRSLDWSANRWAVFVLPVIVYLSGHVQFLIFCSVLCLKPSISVCSFNLKKLLLSFLLLPSVWCFILTCCKPQNFGESSKQPRCALFVLCEREWPTLQSKNTYPVPQACFWNNHKLPVSHLKLNAGFVCAFFSKWNSDFPYFTCFCNAALYLLRVVWSIWQVRKWQHAFSDMVQYLRRYSGLNLV